jgi:4-hydroxy-4-methyl-2-oxoglutarate aldolase
MKFTVFSGGITPLDTKYRGELAWYDVPSKIHGVDVVSGDLVFGDVVGVVIIPKKLVETVLDKSLQKVSDENMVREKIVSGESLEKVFADHGIL